MNSILLATNFILSVTHELKTPLATKKILLQTLLKHPLDETKRIENVSEVSSKSYYSQEEIDLEIELKKENNELSENIEDKVTIEYTDEINEAIKKADLLYLAADHLKCINFCKQILKFFYLFL